MGNSAPKVIFDFDGTLFEYYWGPDYLDKLPTLAPSTNMVETATMFHSLGTDVYVCSAVNSEAEAEMKRRMIKEVLPFITPAHCLFPYDGARKARMFDNIGRADALVDDFTKNLMAWPGLGVKFYNGVNGTKGTWRARNGFAVNHKMSPEAVVRAIVERQKSLT